MGKTFRFTANSNYDEREEAVNRDRVRKNNRKKKFRNQEESISLTKDDVSEQAWKPRRQSSMFR